MPIAIIGIALRAPGDGADSEKFWRMLLDARSARSEIPKDRYNIDGFYHPDPERLGSIQPRYARYASGIGSRSIGPDGNVCNTPKRLHPVEYLDSLIGLTKSARADFP